MSLLEMCHVLGRKENGRTTLDFLPVLLAIPTEVKVTDVTRQLRI
jgi:hypothetical protein